MRVVVSDNVFRCPAVCPLPLSILAGLERLQNSHVLLECGNLLVQLRGNLGVVITELLVEVGTVRSSRHGSRENRLHEEGVVWLEGTTVGILEGNGQLGGGVVDVVAKSLGREVKATVY